MDDEQKIQASHLIAEGLEQDLARAVVIGAMLKEQALTRQRLRRIRPHKFALGGIENAMLKEKPVLLNIFGSGWKKCLITNTYAYKFQVQLDTRKKWFSKLNVKMVAPESAEEFLETAPKISADTKAQGLAARPRSEPRFLPRERDLAALMDAPPPHTVVLRDGEIWTGRVLHFGRWDLSLALPNGGPQVEIFFHALHKDWLPPR